MPVFAIMDIEPQLSGYEELGPEPCLSDMVFRYYRRHFDEEKSRHFTNLYIETLDQAVREIGC